MVKRATIKGKGQEIFGQAIAKEHPVDAFTASSTMNIVNIPIKDIIPNPDQPRKHFPQESLEELASSIKTRGVLQPVIVKQNNDNTFMLVAGERRYRAAKIAGMAKLPCLIRPDDPLEISIIENLQRENLNAIEEAEALEALSKRFQYTHDQLAATVGKSRPTVTEILSLNQLPIKIKDECRTSDIWPKSLLLQVVRQPDQETMMSAWSTIKEQRMSVKAARKLTSKGKAGARTQPNYKYTYKDPDRRYTVTIHFRKKSATDDEVREALQTTIKNMKEICK